MSIHLKQPVEDKCGLIDGPMAKGAEWFMVSDMKDALMTVHTYT